MACHAPVNVRSRDGRQYGVRCGRCRDCRHYRVSSWVARIVEEARGAAYTFFVTFTYADGQAEVTPNGYMTLNKRHLQLMFKRMRKAGHRFKYYAVGEYGGLTARPHYHVVFVVYDYGPSPDFSSFWPYGHVHVGGLTVASVAYTLKYIDKAFYRRHARDDRKGHFSIMSKGIGASYVARARSLHASGNFVVRYTSKSWVYMPRYYAKKFAELGIVPDVQQIEDYRERSRHFFPGSYETFEQYQMSLKNESFRKLKTRINENRNNTL